MPVLTVDEVVKRLARVAGDETAAAALGPMQQGQMVPIDLNPMLAAAINGWSMMADRLIYATARQQGAKLGTQDRPFEGLPGLKFLAKN